jgi:hypothetical protein
MNRTKSVILAVFLTGIILFSGCGNNAVDPGNGIDNVSLSVKTVNSTLNPNSIIITEAKALISEVEAESSDGTSSELKIAPFVIKFDLNNILREVFSTTLPLKQYKKIKFQIHKPEDNEIPPDPEFKEGTSGNQRYSFIIKGTYNGNPFVYKSKKSVNLVLNLNTPVNIQNTKTNITMLIHKMGWFLQSGSEIDPRDLSKENIIDDNIKNSFISVFEDKDRDGEPDGK